MTRHIDLPTHLSAGNSCLEIKVPQDLERELSLNYSNIFHAALTWFFYQER